MNILDFQNYKSRREKISMVTCYDATFAAILAKSSIDCILVGDSAAMVVHGHTSTIPATLEMMAVHIAAVVRGAPNKFIIGDLPFLSFRKDLSANMEAAAKLMQAGCHALKLEGAEGNLSLIRHLVDSGVPVMGHLGLTPQSIHQLGGFRVQGRNPEEYDRLIKEAVNLQEAGCFSLVLECVPAPLAAQITQKLRIPTIGIGAGANTDGQVLVLYDLLGLKANFQPKFLRKYLQGEQLVGDALEKYHKDVKSNEFPLAQESYV